MTRPSQLILSKSSQWTEQEKYPASSIGNPLFIFNRENNNIVYLKDVGSRNLILLLSVINFYDYVLQIIVLQKNVLPFRPLCPWKQMRQPRSNAAVSVMASSDE